MRDNDGPPWLIGNPDEVSAAWLEAVLRHAGDLDPLSSITDWQASAIGTGQVGSTIRYRLQYGDEGPGGPESLVCKFASADPATALTGVNIGAYETEVRFYRELVHRVDVRTPRCYFADIEPGTANVVLALEDLAPAEQGDQIIGCSVAQAELVVAEAARLHGPVWGSEAILAAAFLDPTSPRFLREVFADCWVPFVDRYLSELPEVLREQGQLFANATPPDRPVAASNLTLTHCDMRLDNIMFPPGRGRPILVDWQLLRRGVGAADIAYFMGTAFDGGLRRSCEERLLRDYHASLLAYGIQGYSLDQCWDDYVASAPAALQIAVISSSMVAQTDRGDEMFLAMAERSAQMMSDLGTFAHPT
jgi:Ecdysteroid kinase-like family